MLINLHTHLEGRVRASTARELARSAGVPAPVGGWDAAFALDGPSDLTVYLEKVAASYPFFADLDGLRRIAMEAVIDSAADGQDYLELRFGPASHIGPGRDLHDIVLAMCDGVAEGSRVSGMPAGVVVAILRHHDDELNRAVARAAAAHAGAGVVGFDLAGDELRFPSLAPFSEAFAIAGAAGLGLTCHAAEAAPGPSAREAHHRFGVTRIGHGAHLVDDPDTLRWAAESGIVVEVCPTSNLYTGAVASLDDHPARAFTAAGVRLVLGDDNPTQTRSPLSAERSLLAARLGLSAAQLGQLDRTSIDSGFMEDSVRTALQASAVAIASSEDPAGTDAAIA